MGKWVLGEVVGIGLSNATFQFEDAGIAGFDEFFFVGNGALEVCDAGLLPWAMMVLRITVGHFCFDGW